MSKLTKALTAAAGNAGESLYVEDVFSTYLYDGNSSTQTITNGIDLSGEGGMIWTKGRTTATDHYIADTERGINQGLFTNSTAASVDHTSSATVTAFNSDGYTLGSDSTWLVNWSGNPDYASWTFRKAEKFFDVVTWTGDGTGTRTIAHNLNGGQPGCIIVKRTDAASDWMTFNLDGSIYRNLVLNSTAAENATRTATDIADESVMKVSFMEGWAGIGNASGETYVAYLFASDAGGFGDDGSESIIKCGSYTGNGSTDGPEIDCGFEPQLVLVKMSSATGNWLLMDVMRGMATDGNTTALLPNSSGAEFSTPLLDVNATGFQPRITDDRTNGSGGTYIYIAIRRPMKTPESGTEVFATAQRDTTAPIFEGGFPVDAAIIADVSGAWTNSPSMGSRLTGKSRLATSNTNAEASDPSFLWDYMNGWGDGSGSYPEYYSWMFKRATGFFDVVAYTGDYTARTINHNLGVTPELMIVKSRTNGARYWMVYSSAIGNDRYLVLNDNWAQSSSGETLWNSTTPTSDVFSVGAQNSTNENSQNYIAYLFATLAGVSKVGSYTGNGTSQTIDCGFSNGARFVLLKNASISDNWYVFDTVRGIVSGADPYLRLNFALAQQSQDFIDPDSSGFAVSGNDPANNKNGSTYIFLAIA